MNKKNYTYFKNLFAINFFIVTLTFGNQIDTRSEIQTEVEIDLNKNTLISKEGVNLKYGTLQLKVFNLKMDKKENMAYIHNEFYLRVDEPTGEIRIESRDGKFDIDKKSGSIGKNFGYIEVGQVTGAEKPNDLVYFGGEKAQVSQDITILYDAWMTTDPKIVVERNPESVAYHIKSNQIEIEPDKQIKFKNSNLYFGKRKLPIPLPWYSINIRQGSEVPLFPSFGTNDDFGYNISSGFLWGNKDSKFKGGFAPKYGDMSGFIIGRMENWYDVGKYGNGKLNITDWLVAKKDENYISNKKVQKERTFNRWDFDYTHTYSGEKGKLDIGYRNATYNMIPALDDAIDTYFFGKHNENRVGNTWNYIDEVPEKGKSLEFYNLNSNLEKLGVNKDISIKTDVKLVSDKEVYSTIVADALDGSGYLASSDNDLYSDIAIKKENEKYSIGGYYNYLDDLDPGSNVNDLKSKAEDFGFNFEDKTNKIQIEYNEKNGNEFRKLNSWERTPNFSNLDNETVYGIVFDYTPWTVEKYEIKDSKDFNITFGEYNLFSNVNFKTGYLLKENEELLSLQNDPFREITLRDGVISTNNYRALQYNRYENVIYNNVKEEKGYVSFLYEDYKIDISGGRTKEEIWDRDGIYTYLDISNPFVRDAYKIYINNSEFYEMDLSRNEISLNNFGNLNIFSEIRVDNYVDGYDNITDKEISTNDSSIRYRIGFDHNISLYEENINNTLSYSFQTYDYKSDGKNLNITKNIRLYHKENNQNIRDTIEINFYDWKFKYQIGYENIERASTGEIKQEILNQKLDIEFSENIKLDFNYDLNKNFTNANTLEENFNDLNFENFGTGFTYDNSRIYFKNNKVDYNLWEMKGVNNSFENMEENIYGYTYTFENDNKLNFEFIQSKDFREEIGVSTIDNDYRTYSVNYFTAGDVERRYNLSYSKYKTYGAWNSNLVNYNSDIIHLSYSYKDKRFTDEELVNYARAEYNKSPSELSTYEIENIRTILETNRNRRFDLDRIIDDRVYSGNYKRELYLSLTMERNEKRYEQTGDYLKSLEDLQARIFYSYNRIGMGYIYDQSSGYSNYGNLNSWRDVQKEHEVSLHAKIGKPSEGWRTKAYVKFYDQLENNSGPENTFDGFGIEVGKEFGFYEWSVIYERDYAYNTKNYEWNVGFQFKLLTFPDMNIFGIGASTNANKKTSMEPYLFDGIEIDEIDD